jgi:hypothetical protein
MINYVDWDVYFDCYNKHKTDACRDECQWCNDKTSCKYYNSDEDEDENEEEVDDEEYQSNYLERRKNFELLTNEERLFELIRSMFCDFREGNFYLMRATLTETGSNEKWVIEEFCEDVAKYNMNEILALTNIAIEQIWRVKNIERPLKSWVLIPEVICFSFGNDGKTILGSNLHYDYINCDFLKKFTLSELTGLLDNLLISYANQVRENAKIIF